METDVIQTITVSQACFLMIIWFLIGRQLGHVGAKYARRKRSSIIILMVLCLIGIVSSFIIFGGVG